jgi:putative FmdB family regulatory protein
MPNYDYECTECGHTYEVFQQMTAKKLTTCPKCKGKTRRLIGGGSGIIFKGSGFYQTDYKKTGTATDAPKPVAPKPVAPKPAECPHKREGCNGCH